MPPTCIRGGERRLVDEARRAGVVRDHRLDAGLQYSRSDSACKPGRPGARRVDDDHARAILESHSSRDELVHEPAMGLIASTVDHSDARTIEGKRIFMAGSP